MFFRKLAWRGTLLFEAYTQSAFSENGTTWPKNISL
jgi:hypothetical protein